ncbi:hypothetical protein [Duganella vulcania]|uniref:Uncharacterized protein n=1 Tax=Duganella vulcania TaxID=2692166 RepID=A0A845GGJ6_9BURK|nr:hypothetical protein [Duganella vulcania]MYM92366.1 hypothetical protein [Duganella vulcania]
MTTIEVIPRPVRGLMDFVAAAIRVPIDRFGVAAKIGATSRCSAPGKLLASPLKAQQWALALDFQQFS